MQVRRLRIQRFRGIEYLDLHPRQKTVLVGPNNSGKSTVLEALDLLLHSGAGRPRPNPTEVDYFDRDPSQGFRIEAILGDLDDAALANATDALEGWDIANRRGVAEPDGDGVEPIIRVEVAGTPDLEYLHSYAKSELTGRRFGRGDRSQIGWVFDGRSRDPSRQLAFYQGGLLDQLFRDLDLDPAIQALRDGLEVGADRLNDHPIIAGELRAIENDLRALGLMAEGETEFEAGAISRRELLQSLRLAMPGRGDEPIPILRQGRGAQRLVVLAILLRLARVNRGPSLIGAFEEPEEALEPLRQTQAAQMLAEISSTGGQIFVTTHSPDVVRAFDLADIVLIEPGPRPRAIALADTVTGRSRTVLERRIDSPFTRALFVPIPVIGEGPSDKPVFDVFWRHLASQGRIRPAEHLGVEAFAMDGASSMPMAVRVLSEAGKDPVALIERDVTDAQAVIDEGLAKGLLLYPDDPLRNNLERLIARSFEMDALVNGMTAVAAARREDWAAQQRDLLSRLGGIVIDARRQSALKDAPDLATAMAGLLPDEAQALVAACLAAKSDAPFGIKSTRPARIFAEALVMHSGVVEPFASAIARLAEWAGQAPPRQALQITLETQA